MDTSCLPLLPGFFLRRCWLTNTYRLSLTFRAMPVNGFLQFVCRFLFIHIYKDNFRPDFYDIAPGDKQLIFPAEDSKKMSRPRQDQRTNAPILFIDIQIYHISEAFAVFHINDVFFL